MILSTVTNKSLKPTNVFAANFYLSTMKSNFKPNIPCGLSHWKKRKPVREDK